MVDRSAGSYQVSRSKSELVNVRGALFNVRCWCSFDVSTSVCTRAKSNIIQFQSLFRKNKEKAKKKRA